MLGWPDQVKSMCGKHWNIATTDNKTARRIKYASKLN